jgi:hypothetical protein
MAQRRVEGLVLGPDGIFVAYVEEAKLVVLYQHTQRGTVMLVSLAAVTAFILAIDVMVWIIKPQAWSGMLVSAIVIVAVLGSLAWYFSSMTVVVTKKELRWHFRLGKDRHISRQDIESVAAASHPWFGGYGLRWFGPKRWVYIVSGRKTVEVRLKAGGWRRLGTDDPQGLIKSLTS